MTYNKVIIALAGLPLQKYMSYQYSRKTNNIYNVKKIGYILPAKWICYAKPFRLGKTDLPVTYIYVMFINLGCKLEFGAGC